MRLSMETVRTKSVVKTFGEVAALDGVTVEVAAGELFFLLGSSGCGKTTIMRMIAGFLDPSSGDIRIKGGSVLDTPPNKRPVNMVFQHLALFPMMTIADNIGYGLRRRGMARKEIDRKVDEALDRIDLPGIGGRKVDELSGGQKQRVAIARCMVLEPDVLLLDEPLGALDLKLREHMKVELKALQAAFDTTFLYITHDQSEALVMSDQVAVMNAGRFEQVGSGQDLYYRPETPFVAGFIGESNRWNGRIERAEGGTLQLRTDTGLAMHAAGAPLSEGDKAEIFVRPESIRLASSAEALEGFDNQLKGTVTSILFNGAASRVLVQDEAGEILEVALPQSGEFASLRRGDTVHVGWGAGQATCFGAA
jgi:spermidine/putrescine transport system ATP-binding protein